MDDCRISMWQILNHQAAQCRNFDHMGKVGMLYFFFSLCPICKLLMFSLIVESECDFTPNDISFPNFHIKRNFQGELIVSIIVLYKDPKQKVNQIFIELNVSIY